MRTCPVEAERIMNVEPGQGTEDVASLEVPRGSWSSRKSAADSGGVIAPQTVESSGSDIGAGESWLRDIVGQRFGESELSEKKEVVVLRLRFRG